MATPLADLSPDKMKQYRQTAMQREQRRIATLGVRRQQAWELARKAARVLRDQFHVQRVAVFGSLLHEARFTEWSDIDIAAWGIAPEQTFRAIGAIFDLDSAMELNLVDVNTCPPSLLKAIEEEAVEL